jgi:hypothetical protein
MGIGLRASSNIMVPFEFSVAKPAGRLTEDERVERFCVHVTGTSQLRSLE